MVVYRKQSGGRPVFFRLDWETMLWKYFSALFAFINWCKKLIVIITVSFFHLYTKFTMSSSNNTIAPPRLVRSGSSAHYAIAPSPLRRADSRHVQSVPFGLTRSYSNAPPLMRTESGEVQCFDEPFDESNHGGSAIDGGTVDLATDWFPRDDSTQITPLHISNAQSASPRSLITAHFVGVLNVQRCNLRWAGL